jgi:hypothetical protein
LETLERLLMTKAPSCYPEKAERIPKDFALQKGTASKRADTELREKYAAETGWKQDVSNRPLSHGRRIGREPVGAENLSD